MSRRQLASVRWYLGLPLLPEHFQGQEAALRAESQLRAQLGGRPDFGVGRLRWHEELLQEGVLQITELQVVFSDGSLVDIPGSAVCPPLSLTSTGATRLTVYLHLLDKTQTAQGNPLYKDDPRTLERIIHQAQLSISDRAEGGIAALRLAEFQKGGTGQWSLLESYLPPLLQVGASPFLMQPLASLQERLEMLEQQLVSQLQDTFLRLERLAVIRATLTQIYLTLSLLDDLRNSVHPHPYEVFARLRELYLVMLAFHEALPEQRTIPYKHEDLGSCFGPLLAQLGTRLRLVGAQHSYVPFAVSEGVFRISSLPAELQRAQEVYLLIQRANLHEQTVMEGVKLASASRLVLQHRMVLKGIPFQHLPMVHFQHSFGPEIEFYQLLLNDEWAFALREGSLAFYQPPQLLRVNAFLFWR